MYSFNRRKQSFEIKIGFPRRLAGWMWQQLGYWKLHLLWLLYLCVFGLMWWNSFKTCVKVCRGKCYVCMDLFNCYVWRLRLELIRIQANIRQTSFWPYWILNGNNLILFVCTIFKRGSLLNTGQLSVCGIRL